MHKYAKSDISSSNFRLTMTLNRRCARARYSAWWRYMQLSAKRHSSPTWAPCTAVSSNCSTSTFSEHSKPRASRRVLVVIATRTNRRRLPASVAAPPPPRHSGLQLWRDSLALQRGMSDCSFNFSASPSPDPEARPWLFFIPSTKDGLSIRCTGLYWRRRGRGCGAKEGGGRKFRERL